VGPRAGLDVVVKEKIPSLCRNSNHRSSGPESSLIQLSYAYISDSSEPYFSGGGLLFGSSNKLYHQVTHSPTPVSTHPDTQVIHSLVHLVGHSFVLSLINSDTATQNIPAGKYRSLHSQYSS
jgi:hypothetical protein